MSSKVQVLYNVVWSLLNGNSCQVKLYYFISSAFFSFYKMDALFEFSNKGSFLNFILGIYYTVATKFSKLYPVQPSLPTITEAKARYLLHRSLRPIYFKFPFILIKFHFEPWVILYQALLCEVNGAHSYIGIV